VHLEYGNTLSYVYASQLVVVEAQAMAWRPQNCMFICWGFFVVIDGLHVDLVNP
jgi:hypothetical protein